MRALVFGAGIWGVAFARRWIERGHEVWAVTRRQAGRAELEALGAHPIIADVAPADTLGGLPDCEVVLFCRRVRPHRRSVDRRGLRERREERRPGPAERRREAGLYQLNGRLRTGRRRVRRRIDSVPTDAPRRRRLPRAEQALEASRLGDRTIVLRLAGIYGPGRLPRLDALRRGESLAVEPDAYLNLIQADDAAEIVVGAADRLEAPDRFVVSDGEPVLRRGLPGVVGRIGWRPAAHVLRRPVSGRSRRRQTGRR